jgi:eukaryotic-like serine/threonine-protein kinase
MIGARMQPNSQRLRQVFDAALELTFSDDRAAYLERACGDDRQLRQEVEALLRNQAAADAFFGNAQSRAMLSEAAIEKTAKKDRAITCEEGIGSLIGRYKLREQIGEGGCGVVYVAEQEEPVRRRVGLKVIKAGMDTRAVVARFEGERQALAMMDHPNIAKVFDAGTTSSGRPYFVMELVRGIKMTDYCDQNRLSPQDRLSLFIQVCHAIQHAHQKGIIHRDLKPSNILVTLHDGVPVPKVIDFGIAKAVEGRLSDKTIYTELHQFIGTPTYMSPEQAEMSGLDIDTRTDIYSLGVLLYELLTGRTPFEFRELIQSGLDEIRRRIREVEPPRPSTRLSTLARADLDTVARARGVESLRLRTLLRGDLDWIVMKCLEKDRTRRYDTPNSLAGDLERHLAHEPVLACPPSSTYRLRKFVRRHRLGVSAILGVVGALAIGLIGTTLALRREQRARVRVESAEPQADAARARESAQRAQADGERRRAERSGYNSDMTIGFGALAENDLGLARDRLDRHRPLPGQFDFRGWEWRYLWRATRSDELFTFCSVTNYIRSLALSADGRYLALSEALGGGWSCFPLWEFGPLRLIYDRPRIGTTDSGLRFRQWHLFAPDWFTLELGMLCTVTGWHPPGRTI